MRASLTILAAAFTVAAHATTLTWIPGSTTKVEQMIGDCDYTAQGRMATLTTSPGQANEAITTWHYDPQRGWLTFKEYDDGKGTAWVRFDGGRDAIVGGSRVER